MKYLLLDIKSYLIAIITRRPFNWVRTDLVIKRWRKRGIKIGNNCYVNYDVSLERGVEIGDGTTITGGTIVLTHDAVPATFCRSLIGVVSIIEFVAVLRLKSADNALSVQNV